MFLLGNWVMMEQEEVVVKDRDLKDKLVRGKMQYKYLSVLTTLTKLFSRDPL